jgi:threonine synthase
MGDEIYLVVPSGNFGNALGGYYAKKAGLPIRKILIASNVNNILTDWINKGEYDLTGRELVKTDSPAMDILKSSNIERIMFDKFGPERTKVLMDELSQNSKFKLTDSELTSLREDFDASFSNDKECEETIGAYAKKGYIMDPHTATCIKSYEKLRDKKLPTIVYSTAEWTKFSMSVARALGYEAKDDIDALKWVSKNMNTSVPAMINALFDKKIIHQIIVEKESIKGEMLNFL